MIANEFAGCSSNQTSEIRIALLRSNPRLHEDRSSWESWLRGACPDFSAKKPML